MRTIFLIYFTAFIGILLACSAFERRHLPGKEIVLYSENIRSSSVNTEDR
ncbi:hypothetical protein SLEP1_g36145 [Rubroshorea leprosula]|uniref:Lipoprotein n=1 Tax=Rubroshorea leprosula TaxID=152421 RepID=A0AAV5KR31_9ROSI|nr:hypothetical protein SLEP1_g36145 [Rubroshorea leprosula]